MRLYTPVIIIIEVKKSKHKVTGVLVWGMSHLINLVIFIE